MDAGEQRLEALEAENERLRDRVEELEALFGQRWLPPMAFALTGSEARLFGRFLRGGLCTKDHLMTVCYRDGRMLDGEEPEMKIIDVFVCKLRRKIKRWGLEIGTVWGQGYQMSPEMITKFESDWPAYAPGRERAA